MLLHYCLETMMNTIHVHQIQIMVVKKSVTLESPNHYFNKQGKSICAVVAMKEL